MKESAHQTKVSELMASSEAYPVYSVVEEQVDSLGMTPMLWRNAADFDIMDNMAEFLLKLYRVSKPIIQTNARTSGC